MFRDQLKDLTPEQRRELLERLREVKRREDLEALRGRREKARGAEKDFPGRHLISRNVANGSQKIEGPHAAISIFNFHYASPPEAVDQNYGLGKVIGDNETGFKGTADRHYRMEAWEFILAGGGLYNNLDYSFVAGHEDGSFAYPPSQPGGGTARLRKLLRFLKDLMDGLDLVRLRPDPGVIRGGVPEAARARRPGDACG